MAMYFLASLIVFLWGAGLLLIRLASKENMRARLFVGAKLLIWIAIPAYFVPKILFSLPGAAHGGANSPLGEISLIYIVIGSIYILIERMLGKIANVSS